MEANARTFWTSFLDGFTMAGFFGRARIPGEATRIFAEQPEREAAAAGLEVERVEQPSPEEVSTAFRKLYERLEEQESTIRKTFEHMGRKTEPSQQELESEKVWKSWEQREMKRRAENELWKKIVSTRSKDSILGHRAEWHFGTTDPFGASPGGQPRQLTTLAALVAEKELGLESIHLNLTPAELALLASKASELSQAFEILESPIKNPNKR